MGMSLFRRSVLGGLIAGFAAFGLTVTAGAAEIRVMISGAFTAAYNELVPAFEQRTGHKVITSYGASMGVAPDAIPVRLQRGEPADVVILAAAGLEKLTAEGRIAAGTRVDIVRSAIGLAVRAGAPKPDISTVAALRRTLLEARSIAYSASASGVYLSEELFPRLGIVNEMNITARKILSERVGAVVARGDAELGFQQVSELLPITGIDYVGPLPEEVQRVSVFTSAITANAREPEAARALIAYLTSPEVAAVVRKTGLDPIPGRAP